MSPPFGRTGKVPDYYALLGLSTTASTSEIRKAYKRESLQHHPDRNDQSPESNYRFQLISDAYYTLNDASLRRQYDAARRTRGTTRVFESQHQSGDSSTGQRTNSQSGGSSEGFNFGSASSAFNSFWNMYTNSGGGKTDAQGLFFSMFEEFLKPKMAEAKGGRSTSSSSNSNHQENPNPSFGATDSGPSNSPGSWGGLETLLRGGVWSTACMVALAIVGYAVADSTGAIAGAAAGRLVGGIRDQTGQAAMHSWKSLTSSERTKLLTQLVAWFAKRSS